MVEVVGVIGADKEMVHACVGRTKEQMMLLGIHWTMCALAIRKDWNGHYINTNQVFNKRILWRESWFRYMTMHAKKPLIAESQTGKNRQSDLKAATGF